MYFVLNKDIHLTSRFQKSVQKPLGTQLRYNIAFHPKINGSIRKGDSNFGGYVESMYL